MTRGRGNLQQRRFAEQNVSQRILFSHFINMVSKDPERVALESDTWIYGYECQYRENMRGSRGVAGGPAPLENNKWL